MRVLTVTIGALLISASLPALSQGDRGLPPQGESAGGEIEKVPHETFRGEKTLVLTAHIPSKPAIIGAELPAGQPGEVSARTRLGVVPPSPLACH